MFEENEVLELLMIFESLRREYLYSQRLGIKTSLQSTISRWNLVHRCLEARKSLFSSIQSRNKVNFVGRCGRWAKYTERLRDARKVKETDDKSVQDNNQYFDCQSSLFSARS